MASAFRTTQVTDAIRHMIAERSLLAGERVPSIRSCAAKMGVSPSTVVEAYDRLVADGVIRSRPSSGFYVADRAAFANLQPPATDLDRLVDHCGLGSAFTRETRRVGELGRVYNATSVG